MTSALFVFGFVAVIYLLNYIDEWSRKKTQQKRQLILEEQKREAARKQQEQIEINNREASFQKRELALQQRESAIQKRITEINTLESLVLEKGKKFPWLAGAIADLVLLNNKRVADYLQFKSRPALSAAETVRQVGQEKRMLVEQLKLAQYTVAQYEHLFPFLTQFREDDIEEVLLEINQDFENKPVTQDDPVRVYLTPGEYASLSVTERNQRALDRYRLSRKSSYQIGRDYERYIGYLYERQGYTVSYFGIENGKEDLGRDLICRKNGKTEVVQCKYWSKHKLIHEKHINQLFGTTVMLYLDSKKNQAKRQPHLFSQLLTSDEFTAVFYTSTNLSDTARNFANALNIVVHECISLNNYPIIKCHIGTATGEKIYHLPFDQMYDRTKLDKAGEFYAMTVAEAESKGFRRAWRWRG